MLHDELKNFLNFLPEGYLETEAKKAEQSKDEKEIVDFAKKAYPYVYAYLQIFNSCCRPKEEIGIHKFIKDESSRSRFDKFLKDGGDIEKIRSDKVKEEYLSAADLELFKKAEADVHKEVHKETKAEIIGKRKAEFEQYIIEGREKFDKVESKIAVLKKLANESPDWRGEILEKIDRLKERWASYSNEPTELDVTELIEYYGSVANIGESE